MTTYNRVGLIGENSIQFIEKMIEVWNGGGCVVLLDWRMPTASRNQRLQEAGVTKCYIEKRFYQEANDVEKKIEFIPFENNIVDTAIMPQSVFENYVERLTDDEAVIIQSSGTTGQSKGIILSHKAITLNADYIIENQSITPKECTLLIRSFVHSSGLSDIMVSLRSGMTTFLGAGVHPRQVLFQMENCSVTRIGLVPTLLKIYFQQIKKDMYKLAALKTINVGGAVLLEQQVEQALAILPHINIFNHYGLAEVGPRLTGQTSEKNTIGSVGSPIHKDIKIKIVNERNVELPCGEIGRVFVKTPTMFSGYVSGAETNIIDGWLNTNDLGYLDPNGELFIKGRADDAILSKAKIVYPSDVEKIILQTKGVQQCIVFGYPDDIYGEKIICYYISENNNENMQSNILNNCYRQLMEHEVPREVYCIDEFPKGFSGKVSRKQMRKMYENNKRIVRKQ
ncbi:MAG: class I adenylate-forming enzyme family protein [Christensenellaceae bacterium]|jgi:long-chain acyl-CoA synthetase